MPHPLSREAGEVREGVLRMNATPPPQPSPALREREYCVGHYRHYITTVSATDQAISIVSPIILRLVSAPDGSFNTIGSPPSHWHR